MKIKVVSSKNDGKTKQFLSKLKNIPTKEVVEKVAIRTIEKLRSASPSDNIANGWSYEIEENKYHISLYFNNFVLNKNGENMVILMENGYLSADHHWISGNNFIKQPLDEAYYEIFEETRKELNKL